MLCHWTLLLCQVDSGVISACLYCYVNLMLLLCHLTLMLCYWTQRTKKICVVIYLWNKYIKKKLHKTQNKPNHIGELRKQFLTNKLYSFQCFVQRLVLINYKTFSFFSVWSGSALARAEHTLAYVLPGAVHKTGIYQVFRDLWEQVWPSLVARLWDMGERRGAWELGCTRRFYI